MDAASCRLAISFKPGDCAEKLCKAKPFTSGFLLRFPRSLRSLGMTSQGSAPDIDNVLPGSLKKKAEADC